MDKKTKYVIVGISVVMITLALLVPTFLQQTSAKKFNGFLGDFYVNSPFQINATRGETLTVPVDIYGSMISRSVDIVVTGTDSRHGILGTDSRHGILGTDSRHGILGDVTHPQLPQGFSINFPIKNIQMRAMDKKTLQNPLMHVNMTISIDNTVKPGTYDFAIHMIDNNPQSGGDNAKIFHVNVS